MKFGQRTLIELPSPYFLFRYLSISIYLLSSAALLKPSVFSCGLVCFLFFVVVGVQGAVSVYFCVMVRSLAGM
jgi:hypothetical protein